MTVASDVIVEDVVDVRRASAFSENSCNNFDNAAVEAIMDSHSGRSILNKLYTNRGIQTVFSGRQLPSTLGGTLGLVRNDGKPHELDCRLAAANSLQMSCCDLLPGDYTLLAKGLMLNHPRHSPNLV